MSRKSVVPGYAMIESGDISGNVTSDVVSVKNLDNASIIVSWTGTSPVGVLAVQARNNGAGDVNPEPWYELDMGATINISGNSGNHQLVFNLLPFTDLRLVYTATSGSGTLDAVITSKVVGS